MKFQNKKFAVYCMKVVAELQLLGISLTKEQIDREKAKGKFVTRKENSSIIRCY